MVVFWADLAVSSAGAMESVRLARSGCPSVPPCRDPGWGEAVGVRGSPERLGRGCRGSALAGGREPGGRTVGPPAVGWGGELEGKGKTRGLG